MSQSTSETACVGADAAQVRAGITGLWVYPVKSCAGVALRESLLVETGLEFDRAWMVVDEHGVFLSQRELPRMALIQPQLKYHDMVLRAPGMLALHIALDQVEAPVRVTVWDDEVKAYDMGPIAAQWFSDFLGVKARLVRFDPEEKRLANTRWTGAIEAPNQFSDGYPLLVVSEASLAALNDRLLKAGGAAVSMARFRPNLVIGPLEPGESLDPHDEDRLGVLHITTDEGVVQLKPVKPCARCPIPDIDPVTAISGHAVGDMLQSYRQDRRLDGAVSFGMNLVVLQGVESMLRVGQPLTSSLEF